MEPSKVSLGTKGGIRTRQGLPQPGGAQGARGGGLPCRREGWGCAPPCVGLTGQHAPRDGLFHQASGRKQIPAGLPFQEGHPGSVAWKRCASISIPLQTSAR